MRRARSGKFGRFRSPSPLGCRPERSVDAQLRPVRADAYFTLHSQTSRTLSATVNSQRDIADLRKDYAKERLDERDVARDPFQQFARWFDQARGCDLPEPNAMILATADATARPSARAVLLKQFDVRGFV